jgi:two-component system, cell cycle sensor histidine kinase PleC
VGVGVGGLEFVVVRGDHPRGKALSKAQLGGLFFKERSLRLPLAPSGWPDLTVSDTALRYLVATLIALFLVCLGTALVLQLVLSRETHMSTHDRLSTLTLQATAPRLARMLGGETADTIPRSPLPEDLMAVLPEGALEAGRQFAIIDDRGLIRAAVPAGADLDGRPVTEVLAPNFLANRPADNLSARRTLVAAGEEAYIYAETLAPYPGSLVLIQPRGQVLAAWRADVAQISTLFFITFVVLVLLGGAFHWQAARAAESDLTLHVATERLDKALDRGRCGLWDWDIARARIFWSKSMFELLGLEPRGDFLSYGEVAGRMHPEDEPIDRLVDNMLKGGQVGIDQEFRMRHRDGHWVWLRARCELSSAPGEEAPHLIGIAIDITEQKVMDRLNQEAELRLKDAIENISEAFVLWDAENHLVMCNSKYQQFHNLPASVCVPGTRYEDLDGRGQGAAGAPAPGGLGGRRRGQDLRGQDRGRPLAADQRAAHQGRRLRLGRHRHHAAQEARGTAARFRARADEHGARPAEIAHHAGAAVAAPVGAGREILAREDEGGGRQPLEVRVPGQHEPRAEDAAQRHHRLLRGDGAGVLRAARDAEVHRLCPRHPQERHSTCSTSSATFSTCRRSRRADAARAADLRAGGGGRGRAAHRGGAGRAGRREARDRGGERASADARPAGAEAGADQPAGERGQVHAGTGLRQRSASQGQGHVTIVIADTGIGIPPGDLAKLGRAFEQVENQFTKTRSGSGLGLAISKSLVEMHGGTLEIASEVGKGTTVTIVLPVEAALEG